VKWRIIETIEIKKIIGHNAVRQQASRAGI
jgi:hypothetical protein